MTEKKYELALMKLHQEYNMENAVNYFNEMIKWRKQKALCILNGKECLEVLLDEKVRK